MLVLLSGVSGAGKDTIKKELIEKMKNVESLPSFTDRAPRETDIPGKTYNFVTTQEFEEMINKGKDVILVIDIKGAINIPNETITNSAPSQLKDKSQLIFVYCRSGNRSKQAASKLAKLGYSSIIEFGGINSWKGEII